MKKFIVAMLALGLMVGSVGCSSSDDASETTDNAELAEDATSEISDLAAEAGGDEFGDNAEGGDDEFGDFSDDESVSAEGSDSAFDDAAPAEETAAAEDELDGIDDAFAEEGELADAPPLEEDPFADESATDIDDLAASDANTGTDDLLADTSDSTDYSLDETAGLGDDTGGFEEAPTYKPLNKMLTTPYRKGGSLVNAIYIARPGDTLESIATKIYGGPRAEELRATNGHLANRDVVTGDKIYYNSPQRPADDSAIRVYYEDIGLNPEIYVSQPGDNIRSVGKTLLGNDRSWKELYATNMDVESKDILDEGTRIRYWTGDLGGMAPPPAAVAQVEPPAPPPFEEPPPPPPLEEPPPPMPDEVIAANEPPPPPPIEEPPAFEPPPPPPQENLAIQEAPPPPPVEMPRNDSGPTASGSVDEMMAGDDTMTMIAGAIFILAAVAMFIVIRKRKAKKNIEFHTATHTQLE